MQNGPVGLEKLRRYAMVHSRKGKRSKEVPCLFLIRYSAGFQAGSPGFRRRYNISGSGVELYGFLCAPADRQQVV